MLSPLSPSYRPVERPLLTYRLSNVSITTAERSRHISLQINGLYQVIRLNYKRYSLGLFFIVFCSQVGLIKLPHLCYQSIGLTLALFLDSRHFLTQPTARKTRSGDQAQNSKEYKKISQPTGFLAETKNNFSFLMNVDGMKVSNSSNDTDDK